MLAFLVLIPAWTASSGEDAPSDSPIDVVSPAGAVIETTVAGTPPRLVHGVVPSYPAEARARALEGEVVVRCTVLEDGSVGEVQVVSSPDPLLGFLSLEAARELRFEPALEAGTPVQAQVDYRFLFRLGVADQQGNPVPGSLFGTVVDPDGLSIPGAAIEIRRDDPAQAASAPIRITAASDGTFRAAFLSSGRYVARIVHDRFDGAEAVFDVAAGQNLERRFTLFPTGSHEIVVTYDTRSWREVERAPLEPVTGAVTSSYTLTRRDMEATPGSLEDVSRAVHALPGVVSDGDMLASFHARGGETGDVVFLLDRVPLSSAFHLAGFNSIFNPDMIASVDFHAGAAPADVPAATSAVLSVTSWDGTPRQDHRDLDGAVDLSMSTVRALVMGPVGEKSTFALAARRSYLESYFQVMKWLNLLDTAFGAPEYSEVSARWAWRPAPAHRVMATWMHTGDSLALVDSSDASIIQFNGRFELDNAMTLVSVDHRYTPSAGLTWQSTAAWTTDRSHVLRDLGGEYREDVTTRRTFGRTDLSLRFDDHVLLTGTDATWVTLRTQGQVEDTRADPTWYNAPLADYQHALLDLDGDLSWPELSAYLQETWKGPVTLRGGLRMLWSGATDEVLASPSAGLSIPLPTGTVPKVAWGIYHKVPTDPLVLDPDLGNPDIEAERADHYVVGFDQGFRLPGEDGGGLVRVEGYLVRLSNLVVNPDSQASVDAGTTFTNDGSGRNTGIDLLVAGRSGRLRISATYSLLFATRCNPLNTVFDPDVVPAQDQRHTASLSVEAQVAPRWRATARYSFHTGRPVSNVKVVPDTERVTLSCLDCERLGPYHNLDLRTEWRRAYRAWRLSAYIELLNAVYFHSDFVPIASVEGGQVVETMFEHLPIRPFLGIRADF